MLSCKLNSHKAFTAGSRGRASRAVIVRANRQDVAQAPSPHAAGTALLTAATLALNVMPALDPSALMLQPARADEDASQDLTPYQRRQQELERRREMLRQAREQAENKAGAEAAASATADADAAIEAANAERRAMTERLSSELKSSAASTYESTTSRYRGFGGFNSAPAPVPAPAPVAEPEPAPAPKPSFFSAPRQEPKPEPVVEVKKPAPAPAPAKKVEEPKKQQPAGPQKRRGPLPLFLAEVLVLGAFTGVGLAFTKYADTTNKALALAGAKAKELYGAAEQALAKAQAK